jgi:signal peptidase I
MSRGVWVSFSYGVVAGAALIFVNPFTVRRVEGGSMRPTLNPIQNRKKRAPVPLSLIPLSLLSSDVVLVHLGRKPKLGDVVSAKCPRREEVTLVKVTYMNC